MLNRIYIIVGTLAILVLAGAFLIPRFVQWGDYRGRMEELATGVLGTAVTIRGDIDFSLLPQPRLTFTDVLVGPAEQPAATVETVEADFSLMDFLRDNYSITKLVLRAPVVDFTVDESGFLGSGVALTGSDGGVGLGDTTVEDATVRLEDLRSGQSFAASDIDGTLRIGSIGGPMSFQGSALFRDLRYAVRIGAGAPDELGNSPLSAAVQAEGNVFSLALEGSLTPGMAPKYAGTLTYRQAPAQAEAADDIRGDLVFESKVAASTDRVVLSGYTLQPDENRAGTRLTGAASIQLGTRQSFDAVISGGVFSLPPRDANEDSASMPYELVRLLGDFPAPLIPPMPGRIGVDLAEIGLRGFALRDVRVDARTDGESWTVEQFIAQLPGDTDIRGSGALGSQGDHPSFRGQVTVASQRLDGLVALWRKPGDDNPLFNQPATLSGSVILGGDALALTDGELTLAGGMHTTELRVGFGEEQRLDVVAHFGDLGSQGSAVIGAMLPDLGDSAFGISFPAGSFSLTGVGAQVFGQSGRDLVAEGRWSTGEVTFDRLAAADWGGVGFAGSGSVGGTLAAPLVSGSSTITIREASAPALQAVLELIDMPAAWRTALAWQAPADLQMTISPPDETGAQTVTAQGTLAGSDVDLRADFSDGLAGASAETTRLTASLESRDVAALTRQLGLGDADVFAGDSLLVNVGLLGAPDGTLDASVVGSSGSDRLSFSGQVTPRGWELDGEGTLEVALGSASGLAEAVGAGGIGLPQAEGSGQLHWESTRLARLTGISGMSGGTAFAGELSLSATAAASALAGSITVDTLSFEGLAATLFGPAALIAGDGVWPDGPLGAGDESRATRGSITVSAPQVSGGGQPRLGETSFELTWDEAQVRLARFTAAIGEGELTGDLTVCCAGPLPDKTIDGRISLTGAEVDAVATPPVAQALDGVLEGGVQFEATGASIAAALGTLSGEGSFTIADFGVNQLSPGVYSAVADLDGVLDLNADDLGAIISVALGQGKFTAPEVTGAFTLAGGVARISNLIVHGEGARLAGSLSLAAETLALDGGFTLTPQGFSDPNGLVGEDTARITNRITGTLVAPVTALDLEEMVAAIQVRANEIEVDRLEVLRAEDDERQRAAAEERNRLIEEQRQRAAAEAARLAAEEAARLQAEQEAAAQAELERQQQLQQEAQPPQPSNSITVLPGQQFPQPLELPPVNQPLYQPNQPLVPLNQ